MSPTRVSILTLCGVALVVVVGQSTLPVDAQSAGNTIPHRRDTPDADTAIPAIVEDGRQGTHRMLLDDAARRISFQALLTNDQGGPISQPNGQHELDFRLYDSDAGGVPIGMVLDVLVTLDGGVASTQVGPMDPGWFDGTARWMGVAVDNGDELEPLIPLGSVPYAFRVDRVASAELDDNIELGDSVTPGSLQVFDGDDHVGVDISGSPQWVLVHGQDGAPNAWLRAVSFSFGPVSHGQLSLYDETGNTETVQLTANSNTGGVLSLFDTNAVLRSALRAPETGGLLDLHDSAGDTNLTFHGDGAAINSLNSDLTLNAGSVQDVILATGGGQVGVGTTEPLAPLHVETDISDRAIFALNTMPSGVSYGVFGQSTSTSGRGVLGFATADTGTNYGVYGESSSTLGRGVFGRGFYGVSGQTHSTTGRGVYGYAFDANGTNYGVYGRTNSPQGFAAYFAGVPGSRNYFQHNVGIGTENPESLLHLSFVGGIDLIIDADTDNSGESQNARLVMRQDGGQVGARVGFRDGQNSLELMQESGNSLILGTNNSDRMTITSSGDVGIGTQSPESLLHLSALAGIDLIIDADTDDVGEDQNARLLMRQDGGLVVARVGFRDNDNSLEIMQEYRDSLILGTSNSDRVTITSGGNVGIGTTQPDHELVIQGDDPALQIRDDLIDNSANAARLELLESAGGNFDGGAFFWWNGATNKLLIGTKFEGDNTNVLVVDRATSSVGIGTQNPGNYRLAVNGPMRAKEIVVETGWSDFVFKPDYKLPSLEDIETHIKEHGHLPEIPSAKEVAAQGVKVGEMESKLLQKIEELTLHLIDMDKRLNLLELENSRLRQATHHQTSNQGAAQ